MAIEITTREQLLQVKPGVLMVDRANVPLTRNHDGDFAFWDRDELRWRTIGVEEIDGTIHGEGHRSDWFPITITHDQFLNPFSEDAPVSRFEDEKVTLDEERLAELVERVKFEILQDIGEGRLNSGGHPMPITVGIPEFALERGNELGGFSELHDFTDANCYAGMCDEDDNAHLTLGDINAMQNIVDQWLREGGARVDIVARHLYNAFTTNRVADWEDASDENTEDSMGRDYYRDAARNIVTELSR